MNELTTNKDQRIKENIWAKIMSFVAILLLLLVIYITDYDFESLRYNGIILLVISIFGTVLIRSDKFYIEFGITMQDIEKLNKVDMFKLFYQMHPFIAIRNKLNALTFLYILLPISLLMIVTSFFFE